VKEKQESIISIIGLAVALVCSILILLYNQYEISYDRFNTNFNRISRISTKMAKDFSYMGNDVFAMTPGKLGEALIKDIPGIENATRVYLTSHLVKSNQNLFNESGFLYADPSFLEIFTFPVISGDPQAVMNEPFAIFISERMAKKYFGNENPIGKSLNIDKKHIYIIRGLLKDTPPNSHLKFDFLTGIETYIRVRNNGIQRAKGWSDFDFLTYVELSENASIEDINSRMKVLPGKYLDDEPHFKELQWFAQPLKGIHLGGNANFEPGENSDVRYLYLISSIGLFILMIAIFNYMNMITAGSFNRGKEAGMKKVVGNSRAGLILQLVTESVLLSFAGLMLALILVWFILPIFAGFTDRLLTYRMIFNYSNFFMLISLVLIVGIISGFSSAFRLSSYAPLELLNGSFKNLDGKNRSGNVRSVLIVFQYVISIIAVVSTLTILGQLNFIKKRDIGFENKNIINVSLTNPAIIKNPDAFVTELRKNPIVTDITTSSHLPCSVNSAGQGFWEGKTEELNQIVFRMGVDTNFFDFYNLRIVEGRGFSKDFMSDTLDSYIINQTARRLIGWDDPIGKKFGFNQASLGQVVGVVEDFNFQSLNLPIEPMVMLLIGNREFKRAGIISIKVHPGTMKETRLFVEDMLESFSPDYIDSVTVLSDRIDNMYKSDRNLSTMVLFSTVLALILTCLGQYSLSSFTTRKRTKEMAIRKINGAQSITIMALLTWEVLKLIAIALLLAWPISFLIMHRWLQTFAYRINIGPGIFLFSLLITIGISLAVVSYHLFKLMTLNPARHIRHD